MALPNGVGISRLSWVLWVAYPTLRSRDFRRIFTGRKDVGSSQESATVVRGI